MPSAVYPIEKLVKLKQSSLVKEPPLQFSNIVPRVVKPFVFDPFHYNKDGTKKLKPGLADDPPAVLKKRKFERLQKQLKYREINKRGPIRIYIGKGQPPSRVSKTAQNNKRNPDDDGWNVVSYKKSTKKLQEARAKPNGREGSSSRGGRWGHSRGGSYMGHGGSRLSRVPAFPAGKGFSVPAKTSKLPPPPGARKPSQYALQAAAAHDAELRRKENSAPQSKSGRTMGANQEKGSSTIKKQLVGRHLNDSVQQSKPSWSAVVGRARPHGKGTTVSQKSEHSGQSGRSGSFRNPGDSRVNVKESKGKGGGTFKGREKMTLEEFKREFNRKRL